MYVYACLANWWRNTKVITYQNGKTGKWGIQRQCPLRWDRHLLRQPWERLRCRRWRWHSRWPWRLRSLGRIGTSQSENKTRPTLSKSTKIVVCMVIGNFKDTGCLVVSLPFSLVAINWLTGYDKLAIFSLKTE